MGVRAVSAKQGCLSLTSYSSCWPRRTNLQKQLCDTGESLSLIIFILLYLPLYLQLPFYFSSSTTLFLYLSLSLLLDTVPIGRHPSISPHVVMTLCDPTLLKISSRDSTLHHTALQVRVLRLGRRQQTGTSRNETLLQSAAAQSNQSGESVNSTAILLHGVTFIRPVPPSCRAAIELHSFELS